MFLAGPVHTILLLLLYWDGRPAIQLSWVKSITGGLALTNQGLYSQIYFWDWDTPGNPGIKKSQDHKILGSKDLRKSSYLVPKIGEVDYWQSGPDKSMFI